MDLQKLQLIRFEAFKTQNPELGAFDVCFDIGGKTILAHKFMLLPVSTTFSSMISDRWTTKDQPIPIDTYSYDNFHQFLTYLYSGECQLTNDNIFTMIDIAEFYQVAIFKDYCERFLSTLKCTFENFFQFLEIATKYSMDNFKKSIVLFVESNFSQLLNSDRWLQLSKEVVQKIIEMIGSPINGEEECFEKVYEWAEKQAMSKTDVDQNLNLDATVKEMLTDFMPLFDFGQMGHNFVIKFIVAKSLLPGPELSSILLETSEQKSFKIKVEITDENGKIMKGRFSDPGQIYEEIQKLKKVKCQNYHGLFYWGTSRKYRPSQDNSLKKNDGIEWYFIYDGANDLAVKRRNEIIDSNDYLIAEMFPENGFVLNEKCEIRADRL